MQEEKRKLSPIYVMGVELHLTTEPIPSLYILATGPLHMLFPLFVQCASLLSLPC